MGERFFTGNNSDFIKQYPARYIPFILGLKSDADITVFNYWWCKTKANAKKSHEIYQLELSMGDNNKGRLSFFVVKMLLL